MMGSGKSTIGAFIAKKINFEFIDIDKEVEKTENMKIREIFREKGEKYFRKVEEKITIECLKKKNIVVSFGGGTFLNLKIKKKVLSECISFWLNWENDTLINRIINSKNRPKILDLSRNDIIEMIKKRAHIYNDANYKIDCEKRSKEQISDTIVKIYREMSVKKELILAMDKHPESVKFFSRVFGAKKPKKLAAK